MDFETPVREAFTTFATFIPKLLGFLVILLVGYIIAKLVAKLVFFAVFIPFLSAAVGALGIQALQEPLSAFIALIPRIIVAIVLVVIGAVIAGAVKSLIQNTLGGLSYGKVLANVASILILLGFVKSALDQVGIATTVTGPLLYAILGTVAGVVIVGAGGGLIKPMQRRWEDWLDKAADEKDKIKNEARSNDSAYPADPAPATAAYPTGTYAGGDATATTHTGPVR